MKKNTLYFLNVALILVTLIPCTFATCQVKEAWARESKGNTTAIYMCLQNDSSADKILIKAESPVCETTELHDHIQEGSIFKMRPVREILIPAKSSIELKQGGKHIMLIGLKKHLEAGEKVSLNLSYADGSQEQLDVEVKPVHYNATQKHPCNCNHEKKAG